MYFWFGLRESKMPQSGGFFQLFVVPPDEVQESVVGFVEPEYDAYDAEYTDNSYQIVPFETAWTGVKIRNMYAFHNTSLTLSVFYTLSSFGRLPG
jgi:hypothetical protein